MEKLNLFIAHRDELDDRAPQLLIDHLKNVAELAKNFAWNAAWAPLAYQCGLYHDVGKYSAEFQKYIRGEYHKRVDHSTAGAQLLNKQGNIIEAMCVAGHHTGLPDRGTIVANSQDSTFCGRLKRIVPNYATFREELHFPLKFVIPEELKCAVKDPIAAALFFRMLFSCLVDADFLDTETYMTKDTAKRSGYSSISALHKIFFEQLEKKGFFTPHSSINQKRSDILKECIEKASENPGLFSLTVPTGGGKTISSFAFALEHALRYHKKRIIYVIPYTSIIEQTAEVFRSFLGFHDIIEHHSQVEYDDEQEEMERHRLATENWDAPIIVTTNVQFFESLFANKTSRCRKLHNIADSVILFDEAQMLPVAFIKPFTKAIEALTTYFGCTAVLCSATQPHLDCFFYKKPNEIIKNIPELYQFFKRTTLKNEGTMDYEDIAHKISGYEQCLCICLTKEEANEIYTRVSEECFYLSTNLCPVHRHSIIASIKKRLQNHQPCRVVSTSIISVGVDLDFPVVYLENNGIDSLIQGAGRCNREGKRKAEESIVHVFDTERTLKSRFMRQERQCTEVVSNQYTDITVPGAIKLYFDQLYQAKEAVQDAKDILTLSQNLSFAHIARAVKLIEDNTKALFIPYNDEALEILEQLKLGICNRNIMRKAGKYMVNVWSATENKNVGLFEQLLIDGQAERLEKNNEIAVLTNLELYDQNIGLHYAKEEGRGLFI